LAARRGMTPAGTFAVAVIFLSIAHY